MKAPKVSVCIPVFNPGPFLTEAIDSVLAQTFTDFELLVVDDASTQPVDGVVSRYNDPRLRFEKNPHNLGLVGNWNRCIELARGEYITLFHQDDVMAPSNLACKVALLDSHARIGFVYSNVDRLNAVGDRIGSYPIRQPEEDAIVPGCQLFEMAARLGNPVACPAVIARRECYQKLGFFDHRLPFATDLEMWLRLAAHYDIGYIAAPLVSIRVHSGQETARFSSTGKDYQDVLGALDSIFARNLPADCARHARQAYHTLAMQSQGMARWKLQQGKIGPSLRYAAVALKSTARAAFRPTNRSDRG